MKISSGYQTVERALRLLDFFTVQNPRRSLKELCSLSGENKSAVYRSLCSLEKYGLIMFARATRTYSLGYSIIRLASVVEADLRIRDIALPVMRQLSEYTGETVVLTVLDGKEQVTCIEKVESDKPIRVTLNRGASSPPHAGASGKILMAYLPKPSLERILAQPLQRFTPNTMTDPGELRRQCSAIRKQGWAFSDGELDEGVYAISVPILSPGGLFAIASLSVSGPSIRFEQEDIDRHVRALRQAVEAITDSMELTR